MNWSILESKATTIVHQMDAKDAVVHIRYVSVHALHLTIDVKENKKMEENFELFENSNDDIPAVCKACGGPYPACSIGCNLLDDD